MKIPKRALLLWGGRLLCANAVVIPAVDSFPFGAVLLWGGNISVIILLILRYKSTCITLSGYKLTVTKGFFFRRQTEISLLSVCATREIRTPLCDALKLCHLIICQEGNIFLLPPVCKEFTARIKILTEKV